MTLPITIIDAVNDPAVFGRWFRDRSTWTAWLVCLKAMFGLALDELELEIFRKHTGRSAPAPDGYRDATLIIGRRGGKSLILALIAAFLAVFYDWSAHLVAGETGTIFVVASDRRTAAVTMGYLREMLSIPLLADMITRETNEIIELGNGITVEVTTANFRTIRGRTLVCAICDELAFWSTDEGGANPDSEIVAAIRPAMATVPSAMLLKASSPYARKGVLFEDFSKHYGRDTSATLVWRGQTREMNPSVSEAFVAAEYERDPARASAELGAEFRTDIESFVSREIVEACIDRGVAVRPPQPNVNYVGFIDASSGRSDSYTAAIASRDGDLGILHCVVEIPAPCDPVQATAQIAAVLKSYRLTEVWGDKYAVGFVSAELERHGLQLRHSDKNRSDLYRELLPALRSCRLRLLDNPRAVSQFAGLERRVLPGGRERIDHAAHGGAKDDLANAIAGALVMLSAAQNAADGWLEFMDWQLHGVPPGRGGRGGVDMDPIRAPGPEFGFSFSEPWCDLAVPEPSASTDSGMSLDGAFHSFRRYGDKVIVQVRRKTAAQLLKHFAWRAANPDLKIEEDEAA